MFFRRKGARADRLREEVLFAVVSLTGSLILLAGVSVLLSLAAMRMPQPLLEIETAIYRFIAGNASSWVVRLILTFLNDPGIDYSAVVAACLAYIWIKRRSRMVAAIVALGLALSIGAWTIPYTHWFGYRPRPFVFAPEIAIDPYWRQIWSIYPSFPSGHMRELTGVAMVLVHFWPRSRWVTLGYAGFIAFTRIYVGAHFPFDLISGVIIGLMSGSIAVLAMERGSRIISALGRTRAVRRAHDYVSAEGKVTPAGANPFLLRILRAGFSLALVFLASLALGALVFTDHPDLLADYLLTTDLSLVNIIAGRYDLSVAPVVYALFINGYHSLTTVGILILGRSALRVRSSLGQVVLSLALAIGISLLLASVFSLYFGKARPFASGYSELSLTWQSQWPTLVFFPDAYLLVVMALSTLLAKQWTRLRALAYLYPFLVLLSLVYFGVAWPIASMATLLAGYLVAMCSLYLSWQFLPMSSQLGGNHEQRVREDAAGRGHATDRPSIGPSGQTNSRHGC